MIWSEQQSTALKQVENWYKMKSRPQIFRVFGFAGTGKTTLAKHFAESINGLVLYAAYTGKAALMMRKNGCVGASTIHSLIYKTSIDEKTGEAIFSLNHQSPLREAALLIVDECSMVDEEIGKHLMKFRKPILVLGDPAQLPPVAGAGFFTNAEPDIMLTDIHRQAKDNPIIYLATEVREGRKLQNGNYGESLITNKISTKFLIDHEQVIVGRNATRDSINMKIRNLLGRGESEYPAVGDRLICLRNDSTLGIYNGGMFDVTKNIPNPNPKHFDYPSYQVEDVDNSNVYTVKVHNSFFDHGEKPNWKFLKGTQEFDYGYAITTHKAQGSQWDNVLIFDESWVFREEAKRWLYTAITRAQTSLTIYA